MALSDEAKHESVRLGALKLRLAVLDRRLGLTPGLGLVPAEVERARMMDEVRQVVRQIIDVFELRGVPEGVQQEVLDVVEGRQTGRASSRCRLSGRGGVTVTPRFEATVSVCGRFAVADSYAL